MVVYRQDDQAAATKPDNKTAVIEADAGQVKRALDRANGSQHTNGNGAARPIESPLPERRSRNRNRKPPKQNNRKIRWNKKHSALQQGRVRTSGWRLGSQIFWLLLIVAIGWQFIRYVDAAYTSTAGPLPTRPPGVEGFLPISGLMGALDWIYQGTLNPIHPAATVLFLLFVGLAFIFRKSFCGWICPVGFISENLARFGRWLFGKNINVPAWLDFILRGIKYFLLGFFVWAIFNMSAEALHAFIMSPYNRVSDIKMLEFFRQLSKTSAIVIVILAAGSIVINGFWCRYMCPYGALLGIFSWFSPMKIRRDADKCTDCKLCDVACPAKLIISKRASITKVECIGCTDCVETCPVPGALRNGTRKRNLSPKVIAISLVAALVLVTGAARLFGVWQSNLSDNEVRMHVKQMNGPAYTHPGREYTE